MTKHGNRLTLISLIVLYLFFQGVGSLWAKGPGYALNFRGDGYVESNGHVINMAGDQLTVEFWFKGSNLKDVFTLYFNKNYGTQSNPVIVSVPFIGVVTAQSPARYFYDIEANDGSGWLRADIPTDPVTDNAWHHLALIFYKSGSITYCKSYIDGNLIEENQGNGVLSVPNGIKLILNPLGTLDEFRLWKTARSQEQIRETMNKTLKGDEAGLVTYYGFDQTSGKLLDDISDHYNGNLSFNFKDSDWVVSDSPIFDDVSLDDIYAVTTISAETRAEIKSVESSFVTARGVCWNTAGSPTTADNRTDEGTGSGSFASSMTGLKAGTTYYVRAYHVIDSRTYYSGEKSFATTTPGPPTLTTSPVSSITGTSAESGGQIVDDNASPVTERGICWNTTGNPTIDDEKSEAGGDAVSFEGTLSNLRSGTTYYVRAYATNGMGTGYGDQERFTSYINSPGQALAFDGLDDLISLNNVAEAGSAYTIEMWVNPYLADVVQPFMEKYTDQSKVLFQLSLREGKIFVQIGDESFAGGQAFTGWHHLAVVVDEQENKSKVTVYKDGVMEWEKTLAATFDDDAARAWTVGKNPYFSAEHPLKYFKGRMDELRIWAVARSEAEIKESLYKTITGAENGLTAYYRFDHTTGNILQDLTASYCDGILRYMDASSWVVSDAPLGVPVLAATVVSSIGETSAVSDGVISDENGSSITMQGICWNTTGSPTIADSKSEAELGEKIIETPITGLAPKTTYYARAYATNSRGTGYGREFCFSTNLFWVDDNYTREGINDGHTWGKDAFNTIQGAVDALVAGGTGGALLVKDGTYKGEGNKNILVDGVNKPIAIQSENGPGQTIIDCENSGRGFYFKSMGNDTSVLQGFTIQNGNMVGQMGLEGVGGAILCENASPVILNCVLSGNRAAVAGGGISTVECSPFIKNCLFENNSVQIGGGGGMYIMSRAPRLENCVFDGNSSDSNGGGILLGNGALSAINRCRFTGNSAIGDGGGIYIGYSSPVITNSLFTGNSADNRGAGISMSGSEPGTALINCTFWGNTASNEGGGIFHDASKDKSSNLTIVNSILWGNQANNVASQLHNSGEGTAVCVAEYSNIEGGQAGVVNGVNVVFTYGQHNKNEDPLFSSPQDLHLTESSPCVDAGTIDGGTLPATLPAMDLEANPRINGAQVDMGAYEYTPPTQPVISFYPTKFVFNSLMGGDAPDEQVLHIQNSGIDTLNWNISSGGGWLSVTPASGSSTGETDEVALIVDTSGLAAGEYTCDVAITGPATANSPQTVRVTLWVNREIHVPDEEPTIQAALDAATEGDILILKDGIYSGAGNKNIDFGDKAVTIRSENGPEHTVIDCEGEGRAFLINRKAHIEGITIINGRVTGNGGAILCSITSSPTIINCIFENNAALVDESAPQDSDNTGHGGAVYFGGMSDLKLQNSSFFNNTAYGKGGALHLTAARGKIEGCTFNRNNAVYSGGTSGHGGGIYSVRSPVDITGCMFEANAATKMGGGICLDSRSSGPDATTITGSTFKENKAMDGAGLYNSCGLTSDLINCFFSGNSASRYGGAIYSGGDLRAVKLNILNSTILGNTAGSQGGGIRNGSDNADADILITNSILWGNSSHGESGQIHNGSVQPGSNFGEARVIISYSNLEGSIGGVVNEGNASVESRGHIINENPGFAFPDDPHLMAGSPCIGSGTNDPQGGLSAQDLDGKPRITPIDGRVDLGACEFDPTVQEPAIAVSPSAFNLTVSSENPGPMDLKIKLRNRGGGNLNWEVTEECPWLEVDPFSGTSDGDIEEITLRVNTTGLERGRHVCSLTISDSISAESNQIIPIYLSISRDIYVSTHFDADLDDYRTIQEGIDAARDGDTVVIRDGIYKGDGNKNLDFKGKSIVVRSENGPLATVIDCEGEGRGFWFHSGEASDSVLQGIQIRNGNTKKQGGAILCQYASPAIVNCILRENHSVAGGALYVMENVHPIQVTGCVFEDNTADYGGAVYSSDAVTTLKGSTFQGNRAAMWGGAVLDANTSSEIISCIFQNNTAGLRGGAFYGSVLDDGVNDLFMTNCIFYENRAEGSDGKGGGIYIASGAEGYGPHNVVYSSHITNCTLYRNRADGGGGGIYIFNETTLKSLTSITNSVVWDDGPADLTDGADIEEENYMFHNSQAYENGVVQLGSCVFRDGEADLGLSSREVSGNNINDDPVFYDTSVPDLRLKPTSPCVDAGRIIEGLFSDQRGSLRPIDGDSDGTASFDMGAFEYSSYYGVGGQHSVTTAFKTLQVEAGRILIGYENKISWDLRNPFPANDPRIHENGEYEVRLFLDDGNGRRIDLFTTQKEIDQSGLGYFNGFTFGYEHIGTWYPGIEMVSDPGQFLRADDAITIEYGEAEEQIIGGEIRPPANAFKEQQPDIKDEKLCQWSDYSSKLYAVAPGVTTVTWYEDEAKTRPIPVVIGNIWPENRQMHIAGTPPVDLLPEHSIYNAVMMKYSGTGNTLTGDEFRMPEKGYSLLYYYNTDTKVEAFEVVRSVEWNDPDYLKEKSWNIGTAIVDGQVAHDSEHNGYVLNETSFYDGFGDEKSYDRATLTGPIIPVNRDNPGTEADDMAVAWYETGKTGASWPYLAVRYNCKWPDEEPNPITPAHGPVLVKKIIIETSKGSGPLLAGDYGDPDLMRLYNQPDPELPGYNPNEEHALFETSMDGPNNEPALFALRNDLNRKDDPEAPGRYTTSAPYALLKYRDPISDDWAIEVYKVVPSEKAPADSFKRNGTSGMILNAPYPLNTLYFNPCKKSGPAPGSGPYFQDKNGELYAKEHYPANPPVLNFNYPLQDGFFYDTNGDGQADADEGECVSWALIYDGETASRTVDVSYEVGWPGDIPELHVGETLMTAKNGLPEINSQCSVDLLYGENRVRLIDPMIERSVNLAELSDDIVLDDLPVHLNKRLSYDAVEGKLKFRGYFDDSTSGDPLMLFNIMSFDDQDRIKRLSHAYDSDNPDDPEIADDTGSDFLNAVDVLAMETRAYMIQPGMGLTSSGSDDAGYHAAESKALTAGASESTGKVILAFNNCEECTGPVDLKVIQVACPLYTGEIKVIEPENVFDNRVSMRHTGDFGGTPDNRLFEWKYWEDSDDRPDDVNEWKNWFPDTEEGRGAVDIVVEGPGDKTLSDKWFVCRYQYRSGSGDDVCGDWSEWTEPQLYQGWIKRVLAAINLFDQRVKDFEDYAPNIMAGMIQEAGERYEGAAALNYDPDNLDSLGLIEFYQTVLNLGQKLTIDAANPEYTVASNQQLLLVASRLSDLYMLLGNEAYADAIDPTIGFSTDDGSEYGLAVSSIFCFQNQVASLLDEELTLLRGVDNEGVKPFYNRLVWNFTQTEGEVAYSQTYNIFDWNGDGFINEYDARSYYPQGHGDAWGHYLTAIKTYYKLLKHPEYVWKPRAESLLVAGNAIDVDYEDERRFARAAAAKSRTGAEIVSLTYRQYYDESQEGQLAGYKDPIADRAWGVDEWASRAGQGAYFDWVVGNAILPAEDPDACNETNTGEECHDGIRKIDRTTVADLRLIPSYLSEIQAVADKSDAGLNPMGLANNTVPFDIDPAFLEVGSGINGETHFEQIYTRALDALKNTATVFNHASRNTTLLRQQNDSIGDFQGAVEAEERDYNNRLIEIFGYPYPDDCGAGGTYSSDYCNSGPDLYHYMYVDASELTRLEEDAIEQTHSQAVVVRDYDASIISSGGENPEITWNLNRNKLVQFNLSSMGTTGTLNLMKPVDWTDRRKAPGELQLTLSDLLQARGSYEQALNEYDNLLNEIEDFTRLIEIQYGVDSSKIKIMTDLKGTIGTLNGAITVFRGIHNGLRSVAELSYDVADAVAEVFPDDPEKPWEWATFASKGGVKLIGSGIKFVSNIAADIFDVLELNTEQSKEHFSLEADINLAKLENRLAFQQSLLELENLIRSEIPLRTGLFTLAETLNQTAGQHLAVLAEGERLLEERLAFRIITAADIQSYRYKDMAFRIFRNDALNKYRSQFDMAALYTYLAAKAYDYETAMLDSDSKGGKTFLSNIVRQRSIGQVEDGEPLTGSGLADILKRMWLNYQVIEPQMGLNNPQVETNRFSLRQEMFRILPGETSDETWQEVLQAHRVDDLWDLPEFRRYCRPFAGEGIAQPGVVIPFSTTVTSGLNLFGWPLGGGDSYYSSTYFAIKVRSVGVWFANYNSAGMAQTPRVYLVPVGTDVLRSPSGDPSALRFFNVVDQKIPVPFPVAESELTNSPGWIPLVDTIYDELFEIRRHSDFRAYHDSGSMDESEMTFDSRLVGRSVYNDRWLLIIPGRNLYHDADEGVRRFINGPEISGGDGERTGSGVKDIKIFFDTYGYSGN